MHTTRSTIKVLLAALASLALICVTAGAAFAASARPAMPFHAAVLSSDPAIGSTIAQAPTKVTVFTAENMNPDPAKSNLQIFGPSAEATNALISQGNAQISLSNPKQMSINITPTAGHTSGVYIVFWKTVSADDGDPDSGSFTFTVNPAAASSTPTATATKTTAPATTTTNTNSGAPLWVPIVAALVALIVGLGAGFGLGRRKPAASSIGAMRASIAQDDKEAAGKRP
ncbi:MAG TPA: copper resistance CopC family protein [Ktedonobacteraceae bacterium]